MYTLNSLMILSIMALSLPLYGGEKVPKVLATYNVVADTLPAGKIILLEGDIVNIPYADAIVNAANPPFLGGLGVDGFIHDAAGPELLTFNAKIKQVTQNVRCPVGESRISPSFDLLWNKQNRYIIGTAGPMDSTPNRAQLLQNSYRNSINLAALINSKHLHATGGGASDPILPWKEFLFGAQNLDKNWLNNTDQLLFQEQYQIPTTKLSGNWAFNIFIEYIRLCGPSGKIEKLAQADANIETIQESAAEFLKRRKNEAIYIVRNSLTHAGNIPVKGLTYDNIWTINIDKFIGPSRLTDTQAYPFINSIAFPTISTGLYGYPLEEAAQQALYAIVTTMQDYAQRIHPYKDYGITKEYPTPLMIPFTIILVIYPDGSKEKNIKYYTENIEKMLNRKGGEIAFPERLMAKDSDSGTTPDGATSLIALAEELAVLAQK